MHDDHAACLDRDAQHRPQIGQRRHQAHGAKLRQIFVGVWMVEPELLPVVIRGLLLLQQQPAPGMMQLAVVQHDDPG